MARIEVHKLKEHLFHEVETYRPIHGRAVAPDAAMKAAFFDVPRHEFVGRFRPLDRLVGDHCDAAREEHLELVYRNVPLMYVDHRGVTLDASSSEPAFIMHLLSLLEVRPGQRVLEIGSGTGWLIGMIGHIVGEQGAAVGVELQPGLHRQAVEHRDRLMLQNVELYNESGYGYRSAKPFDRIIVTASTYALPADVFALLSENGRLVVPLKNRGFAEEVFVLGRQGESLVSEEARLCKFVEMQAGEVLTSGTEEEAAARLAQANRLLKTGPVSEREFPLGESDPYAEMYAALHFSSYLSKTCQAFQVYNRRPSGELELSGVLSDPRHCLLDEDGSAMEIYQEGTVRAYGESPGSDSFERALERWNEHGRPHGARFDLVIRDAGAGRPSEEGWTERRGQHLFQWRLGDAEERG